MFYFKACKKCRGDLALEKDAHGDYLKCMQCGTYTDVEVAVAGQGRYSMLNDSGNQALTRVRAKTAVAA